MHILGSNHWRSALIVQAVIKPDCWLYMRGLNHMGATPVHKRILSCKINHFQCLYGHFGIFVELYWAGYWTYCWWKTSSTIFDLFNPIKKLGYSPSNWLAGFLPSTVAQGMTNLGSKTSGTSFSDWIVLSGHVGRLIATTFESLEVLRERYKVKMRRFGRWIKGLCSCIDLELNESWSNRWWELEGYNHTCQGAFAYTSLVRNCMCVSVYELSGLWFRG